MMFFNRSKPVPTTRTVYAMKVCCRATEGASFPGPSGVPILVWYTVPARAIRIAIDLVEANLRESNFEFDDVWECHRYDLDRWDYSEFPANSEWRTLAERVVNSNRLEVGEFIFADPSACDGET